MYTIYIRANNNFDEIEQSKVSRLINQCDMIEWANLTDYGFDIVFYGNRNLSEHDILETILYVINEYGIYDVDNIEPITTSQVKNAMCECCGAFDCWCDDYDE
jgi:hypothetical protein